MTLYVIQKNCYFNFRSPNNFLSFDAFEAYVLINRNILIKNGYNHRIDYYVSDHFPCHHHQRQQHNTMYKMFEKEYNTYERNCVFFFQYLLGSQEISPSFVRTHVCPEADLGLIL